jgi:hypothetical protein
VFNFKRSTFFSAVLVLGLLGSFGLAGQPATVTRAQDMNQVTCDSTLVSLLYIAEYNYGFHSMLDVATLDKGQYSGLFDAMMADMSSEGGMMEETPAPDMGMMETATPDMSMESMTTLTPGNVDGEDQFCTDLRAELDTFLYDALTHEMMGEDSGM